MAKQTNKTETSTPSVDDAVMSLLVKVEQKKKEIEKAKTRPNWKTNCTFGRDPSTTQDRTNIQTVRDIRKLVEIYAFLNSQESELAKASTDLAVDIDITWQNFPIIDWKDDIRTRVEQLSLEKKERELIELDIKVNRLVSPDQRRVMELKALQEALQD